MVQLFGTVVIKNGGICSLGQTWRPSTTFLFFHIFQSFPFQYENLRGKFSVGSSSFHVQLALVIRGLFICGFAYSQSMKIYSEFGIRGLSFAYSPLFNSFWHRIKIKIPIFSLCSTASLFAVFYQNVSTANYEGRLYLCTRITLQFWFYSWAKFHFLEKKIATASKVTL